MSELELKKITKAYNSHITRYLFNSHLLVSDVRWTEGEWCTLSLF